MIQRCGDIDGPLAVEILRVKLGPTWSIEAPTLLSEAGNAVRIAAYSIPVQSIAVKARAHK